MGLTDLKRVHLFLVTAILCWYAVVAPTITDVRLVNGSNDAEGRLEVFYDGSWATVCHERGPALIAARVVCRMLGFDGALEAPGSARFGQGTGDILYVSCYGTEDSLADCWFMVDNRCEHQEDAGAVCYSGAHPNPLQVRLIGGPNDTEGRIEVLHEGSWEKVCDLGWDLRDARVVCRMLGFDGALNALLRSATPDLRAIRLLTAVECEGTEENLADCAHAGIGGWTNCGAAGAICYSGDACKNGGTGRATKHSVTCACTDGWQGRVCSQDVNECTDVEYPCATNSFCTNTIGSYTCTCSPGYEIDLSDNSVCSACPSGTYGAYCEGSCVCVVGANCSKINGSCTCDHAFDGAVCDKRDFAVTAKRIPPNETISERNDFTLVCQVNLGGIDLEEVAWYRSGVKLPSTTEDKYFVENNAEMGLYEIKIMRASTEDTGNYTCTAVTEGNHFTQSSEVIAILIPDLTIQRGATSTSLTADELQNTPTKKVLAKNPQFSLIIWLSILLSSVFLVVIIAFCVLRAIKSRREMKLADNIYMDLKDAIITRDKTLASTYQDLHAPPKLPERPSERSGSTITEPSVNRSKINTDYVIHEYMSLDRTTSTEDVVVHA